MSTWRSIEQELAAKMQADEQALRIACDGFIRETYVDIEKEIAAFYGKYGEDNVVAYKALRENLSAEQYALLHREMDEFAKLYPEYAGLLPTGKAIYELDQLEALQASITMSQGALTSKEVAALNVHLNRWGLEYANGALASALALSGFASSATMYNFNAGIVRAAMANPWSGKSFSSRVWKNNAGLGNWLNNNFVAGMAKGTSYAKLVKSLQAKYQDMSKASIYRLIYTEGTYITNEVSASAFQENFDEYILSPVHDEKTCSICLGLEAAQKEVPAKFTERSPGTNFPPLHPHCRCSFIVHVEDWDTWLDEKTGRTDTAPHQYTPLEQKMIDDYVADENGEVGKVRAVQQGKKLANKAEQGRYKEMGKLLENIIANNPQETGMLFRGVKLPAKELDKYVEGYVFDQQGTSSWSGTDRVALDYASRRDIRGENVLFVSYENKEACYIGNHSSLPEDEWLYSKNQKWRLDSKSTMNYGAQKITIFHVYPV